MQRYHLIHAPLGMFTEDVNAALAQGAQLVGGPTYRPEYAEWFQAVVKSDGVMGVTSGEATPQRVNVESARVRFKKS